MMKHILKIILLLGIVLFAMSARADERVEKFAVLASYAWIDYNQSAGWVTPGGAVRELNPVLGSQPSRKDMLSFGALGMAALYLATEILPEPWATVILDSAISSEQFNIKDNVRVLNGYQRQIFAVPIILTFRF